jgi:hypothetical protein
MLTLFDFLGEVSAAAADEAEKGDFLVQLVSRRMDKDEQVQRNLLPPLRTRCRICFVSQVSTSNPMKFRGFFHSAKIVEFFLKKII